MSKKQEETQHRVSQHSRMLDIVKFVRHDGSIISRISKQTGLKESTVKFYLSKLSRIIKDSENSLSTIQSMEESAKTLIACNKYSQAEALEAARTITIAETGAFMVNLDEIIKQSLPVSIPAFCTHELEKIYDFGTIDESSKAADALSFIHSTNLDQLQMPVEKYDDVIESAYHARFTTRTKGLYALALMYANQQKHVVFLCHNKNLEYLSKLQENENVDVVYVE